MLMGSIHLILGPMYSGKTTELLRVAQAFSVVFKTLVVNSDMDNRTETISGEQSGFISTHGKLYKNIDYNVENIDFIKLKRIQDVIPILGNYRILCIDEGQFFTDLVDQVVYIADNLNIQVYVAGLNGNTKRESLGYINNLLPLADSVNILNSKCSKCALDGILQDAPFTMSLIEMKGIRIAREGYIPVCRSCWKKYS